MNSFLRKSRFTIEPLFISGVTAIKRQTICDARGNFSRLFCAEELAEAGWGVPIVQINHTFTLRAGTVRGLHYQKSPDTESKLVTCLRGRVWDVALDLRKRSPTFLQWCARELSAENHTSLLIPAGCAHGFQSLTENAELLYLHSACYAPTSEFGVRPSDPQIGIDWPLPISELSTRDLAHPLIDDYFEGLDIDWTIRS